MTKLVTKRKSKIQAKEKDSNQYSITIAPNPLPTLVKVGRNYIDPNDVSSICSVKDGTLYIVKLKSNPEAQYPLWAKPMEIQALLKYMDIKE
jgi:hypothetical protein